MFLESINVIRGFLHGLFEIDNFRFDLRELNQHLSFVLSERSERTVVSGKLLGHLSDFLVVLKIISHKLEQGLLFRIDFNLSLKVITVILQLL